MFKSKVHFAFYKSLKSRLIFMIFVLVLVPEVVLCFGILNTYESRAVSIRESEVLSQAKILANKISTSKYFDKDGSDLSNIDAQIDTLTTIYEGRVLIVDKHFKMMAILLSQRRLSRPSLLQRLQTTILKTTISSFLFR